MAEAALPDDPGTVVPVAFKVSHELRRHETDAKLADLVARLADCVRFDDRKDPLQLDRRAPAATGGGRGSSGP